MFRFPRVFRMFPALSGVLLVALLGRASAQCTCYDVTDLKKRIQLSGEALKQFTIAMASYGTTPYTPEEGVAVSNRVNNAMYTAVGKGFALKLGTHGFTTNMCKIEITAPTPCLEEAVRRHEEVHRAACEKAWDQVGRLGMVMKGDRFSAVGATMADFCREEVLGYTAEILWMTQELERLAKICKDPEPVPVWTRDFSAGGASPATPPITVKPIKAPPIAKPKPMPVPPPIK